MAGKFLNLDDDYLQPVAEPSIGSGLKGKITAPRTRADPEAVARAGEAHGFTRTTEPRTMTEAPRRGRPPLNEQMTYWRIYVSPDLRERMNALRDKEGRRLNDVMQDMLEVYEASKQ